MAFSAGSPRRPAPGPRLPLIAGAFLVLFAVATTWLVNETVDRAAWVEHTLQVQGAVDEAQSALGDAESGARGYLLTGDESLAQGVGAAPQTLAAVLTRLGALVPDNPVQVAVLARVGEEGRDRLARLGQAIALKRTGQDAQAARALMDPASLAKAQAFGRDTAAMHAEEARLLQARSRQAAQARLALLVASALTGLSTVAFTLVWIAAAVGANRALHEANDELAEANQRLLAEAETRAEAEGQVRQMQKMEAIGQLTGGIAHDFNNMLAVIIGNLNLIERKLARGQTDVHRYAASALEGASRAASLTARLLAFSRQQPLAPQVVDLNRLVTSLSDILRRTLGETVQVETVQGAGLWRATVDPVQLENAILNLAVNARDAMDGAGRLTIETANAHLDEAYAASHSVPAGQYVMIAVTDTGVGMTPEVAARAFDPFFTTKPAGKGTGLGLSQVYGFIKQTHGHVKIYSEPGQGTTVRIYLPRAFGEGAAVREAAAPVQDLAGRPSEVVLVVEDEERVRQFAVEALRELGYTVLHAGDAAEAMAKLRQQPKISLLLTDIVMPDRNGRALANEAAELIPDLPVLYMTGFSRNAVVHNGMLDPGVNFLAKPFSVEQLGAKVREVLDATGA